MLKHHRKSLARTVSGIIAVAALLGGGAMLTPAAAEEAPAKQRKVVKFMQRDGKALEVDADIKELPRTCDGKRAEREIGTDGPGQDRIKVFVCEKGRQLSDAQMNSRLAEALEQARADVEKGELAAGDKAAMLARIDAEIAKLRGN